MTNIQGNIAQSWAIGCMLARKLLSDAHRPASKGRRGMLSRPLFLEDVPFALLVSALLAALLTTSILMFALPD